MQSCMAKTLLLARRGRPADPEARAERRAQILQAAHRCFLRKGFHAATTAEISAEAEISVAGLYQYFSSKEDLILALIELDLAENIALIKQLSKGDDFFVAAEQVAREMANMPFYHSLAKLRLEIMAEACRSPAVAEMMASAEQRSMAALVQAATLAQTRGQIAADVDPYEFALALNCLSDGLMGRVCLPSFARGPFVSACLNLLRRAGA